MVLCPGYLVALASSSMIPRPLPKKAILIFQIAFGLGLLVLLWRLVEGEEAFRLLMGAEPGWIVASFVALTLQTLLSALRRRLTARQLGIILTRRTAITEYYLAQVVNQALPGGVIGDAGRALRARAQAGLRASGLAVVLERLAGQVALFVVMFVGLGIAFVVPGGPPGTSGLAVIFGLLTLGVVVLGLALAVIARTSEGRFGRGLRDGSRAVREAFFPRSVRWLQIGLSLATALCNVAGFTFAAWAIGSQLSALTALALVPTILLAMLVPLTISGWGVREGAAVAIFPLAGIAAVEGLAASVAFGLVHLVATLPGLLFAGGKRRGAPPELNPPEVSR